MATLSIARYFPFCPVVVSAQNVSSEVDLALIEVRYATTWAIAPISPYNSLLCLRGHSTKAPSAPFPGEPAATARGDVG